MLKKNPTFLLIEAIKYKKFGFTLVIFPNSLNKLNDSEHSCYIL